MSIKYKCFKIEQPIGDMYLVKLNAQVVINISSSDIRRPYNDFCEYKGIQRKLEPNRINAIAEFCKTNEAMFPTPIILSANSEEYKLRTGTDGFDYEIEIPENGNDGIVSYCSIIDGQHRLKGIEKSGLSKKFDLLVEFVFDTDPSRDAYLFSVINGNQKPISKSLIYDLYGLSKCRTIEKLCNKTMRILNTDSNSLLRGKIKMLGYKDEFSPLGIVSQARMTDELKKLITDNSKKDNCDIELGKELRKLDNKYILRQCFLDGNDEAIIKINLEYFNKWLSYLSKTKVDYKINEELFLEKSLGLSVAYRVLQLILIYKSTNNEEIDNKFIILESLFNGFFEFGFYRNHYDTGESGMVSLFLDFGKVLMQKQLIKENFLRNYLSEIQYKKICL